MATMIASAVLARILAHAAATPGREVCGLLLGDAGLIADAVPAANVAADPAATFEIDPAALFAAHRAARAGGPAVVGHYHSHPDGSARPSPRDLAAATGPALWLIVAGGQAALWRFDPAGGFTAEPLTLAEGDGCASPGQTPQAPVQDIGGSGP